MCDYERVSYGTDVLRDTSEASNGETTALAAGSLVEAMSSTS
jgi:hypothetical protein